MDKMLVERALKALAEIGATRQSCETSFAVDGPLPRSQSDVAMADCGSPDCAGCYDVGQGKKVHPPKIGADYMGSFKSWEPKGPVQ